MLVYIPAFSLFCHNFSKAFSFWVVKSQDCTAKSLKASLSFCNNVQRPLSCFSRRQVYTYMCLLSSKYTFSLFLSSDLHSIFSHYFFFTFFITPFVPAYTLHTKRSCEIIYILTPYQPCNSKVEYANKFHAVKKCLFQIKN